MSRDVSTIMQRAAGRAELAKHDHAEPCGGCADRDERIAALEQRLRDVDEQAAANWLELVDLRAKLRVTTRDHVARGTRESGDG